MTAAPDLPPPTRHAFSRRRAENRRDADAAVTRRARREELRIANTRARLKLSREADQTRREIRARRRADRAERLGPPLRRLHDHLNTAVRRAAVTVPILAPMSVAWTGQAGFARDVLGWTPVAGLVFAAGFESATTFCGWLYHQARTDGDRGLIFRAAMWLCALIAAGMNYWHAAGGSTGALTPTPRAVSYGLMSLMGISMWELYELLHHRRVQRARGAAAPARPRFGMIRWVRFPRETWRAWSAAIRFDLDTVEDARIAAATVQRHKAEKTNPAAPENTDDNTATDTATDTGAEPETVEEDEDMILVRLIQANLSAARESGRQRLADAAASVPTSVRASVFGSDASVRVAPTLGGHRRTDADAASVRVGVGVAPTRRTDARADVGTDAPTLAGVGRRRRTDADAPGRNRRRPTDARTDAATARPQAPTLRPTLPTSGADAPTHRTDVSAPTPPPTTDAATHRRTDADRVGTVDRRSDTSSTDAPTRSRPPRRRSDATTDAAAADAPGVGTDAPEFQPSTVALADQLHDEYLRIVEATGRRPLVDELIPACGKKRTVVTVARKCLEQRYRDELAQYELPDLHAV